MRVTEQCTAGCDSNGGIANLTYRSQNWAANWQGTHSWRASASYVIGAQSMKVGYQGGYLVANSRNFQNTTNTAYRFNNGIPNQITETIIPVDNQARLRYDSLYAQEQWTFGRVTVQGALRYDRAYSWFPEVTVGPTIFLPTAVTYPETQGVRSYNDLTPRVRHGMGRLRHRQDIGQDQRGQVPAGGADRPDLQRLAAVRTTEHQVTRTWTDANSNFRPDCNLQIRWLRTIAERRRLLRADQHAELREGRLHQRSRSGTAQRIRRPPG